MGWEGKFSLVFWGLEADFFFFFFINIVEIMVKIIPNSSRRHRYSNLYIFSSWQVTCDDATRRFPIFLIFLNFSWPFQNAVETAGMTVPT